MNPKSGKEGKLEAPKEPVKAKIADDGKTGAKTEVQAQPGAKKPGQTEAVQVGGGGDDDSPAQDTRTSWVSIELKDGKGKPVPNEPYEVKLPDGSITTGSLDAEGKAKIEGVEPGQCQVKFPRLHNAEWRKA